MKKRHALLLPLAAGLLAAGSASAQKAELTPDSGLDISADGTCWDDCSVQITPVGDGATVSILKNGSVVDQGYTEAPLGEDAQDAPPPPMDGNGNVSESQSQYGQSSDGTWGTWVTTTNWEYVNHTVRNVSCTTNFHEEDPPEDGGGNGGPGG